MWGPDIPPNSISPYKALFHFVIAASGIVGVGFLIKSLTPEMPAVRRQYPYDGLVKELGGLQENKVCSLDSHCTLDELIPFFR
jgi:NADH dehydrogenase (ubiquinone) 1 beta subcomplex subunit 8